MKFTMKTFRILVKIHGTQGFKSHLLFSTSYVT